MSTMSTMSTGSEREQATAAKKAEHAKRMAAAEATYKKSRPRNAAITVGVAVGAAALVGLGVFGLVSLDRSGEPDTTIEYSGTYEVGEDIAAGNWRITGPEGTVEDPCRFSVWRGNHEIPMGAAGGAAGIPLAPGWTLITNGCGTWTKVG